MLKNVTPPPTSALALLTGFNSLLKNWTPVIPKRVDRYLTGEGINTHNVSHVTCHVSHVTCLICLPVKKVIPCSFVTYSFLRRVSGDLIIGVKSEDGGTPEPGLISDCNPLGWKRIVWSGNAGLPKFVGHYKISVFIDLYLWDIQRRTQILALVINIIDTYWTNRSRLTTTI